MAQQVAAWCNPGRVHVDRLRAYSGVLRLLTRALAPIRLKARLRPRQGVSKGWNSTGLHISHGPEARPASASLNGDGFRPVRERPFTPIKMHGHRAEQLRSSGIGAAELRSEGKMASSARVRAQGGALSFSARPVHQIDGRSPGHRRRNRVRLPDFRGGDRLSLPLALAPVPRQHGQTRGEAAAPSSPRATPGTTGELPQVRRPSVRTNDLVSPSSGGRQLAAEASGFGAPKAGNGGQRTSGATTIHLDGNALGKWTIEHLTRALAKPPAGITSIDPRSIIPRSRVAPF